MIALFHTIIYQPLYNVLIMLYNYVPGHDFGISIILITVLLKGLLWPLSKKQIESQKKMQELQPKLKAVQEKYKNDKEKQTKAVMEFYKTNKANPFSGCLPLVAQLFFLIAIYRVLIAISSNGLVVDNSLLYHFVSNPGKINDLFFGIINLSRPNFVLAILAAGAQFYQTKMLMAKQAKKDDKKDKKDKKDDADFAQVMNKQMLYLGPMLTLFIGIRFAAGLALYWLASTLFMIGQQWYIEKKEKEKESK